ncbi:MAG: Uncharacterised protein [Cyanobium sp. ARS6]|nr:MAG: Uncharacterised protein [Cyanobium sp. ARS6]
MACLDFRKSSLKLKQITGFELHLLEAAPMLRIRLQGGE